MTLAYQRIKGKWPVGDRDVTLVSGSIFKDDGNTFRNVKFILGRQILIAKSTPIKDVPETKEAVRAELIVGGWILTPTGDSQTKAIFITQSDPKGSIPGPIKTYAATK